MPGTRHAIGQELIERYPVETGSLHAIVGSDSAEPNLHHPQRGHHEKELHGSALGRSGFQAEQRVTYGQKFMLHRAWLRSEIPNHAAHARQQQNEAEDAPHYGSAGRLVWVL